MSSTQPQQQEGSRRQLRLLSLDAGGVHSLSTITILKRMMNRFNAARAPGMELEPWQVFDMIGGAETGGLIAIMLGRLRMSLDQCEESFKELCKTIYQPKDPRDTRRDPTHSNYNPNKFDSEVLAEAVKRIIVLAEGADAESTLFKDPSDKCRVFVSLKPHGFNGFRIIPSYPQHKPSYFDHYESHELWAVCAATTASAGLFNPVKITASSETYCPSTEWDDPIRLVGQEWVEQWPGRGGLMISIGSGLKHRETSDGVAEIFKENPSMFNKDMWFRFNLEPSLNNVLKEDSDQLDLIKRSATAFVERDDVQYFLKDCVGKLRHTFESHLTAWND